jgi:hypothetical protein
LDSKFLGVSAEINAIKAKNLKLGEENEISLDEFVEKVITSSMEGVHDDEALDWKLIGERSCIFGKRAYTMDFLLGPLNVERKDIKRQKGTRVIKNKENLVRPAQVRHRNRNRMNLV